MQLSKNTPASPNTVLKSILFCLIFTVLFLVFSLAKRILPIQYERIAQGILGTLAAGITIIIFLRYDRLGFSDIGLSLSRNTLIKFLAGLLVGILVMGTLIIGVAYISKQSILVNPDLNILYFLWYTLPLIPLAFMEELAFRSYPLEILKGKKGLYTTILITAILFAFYHVANGWTIGRALAGPAIWGFFLCMAAIYSKGIALPTGIHYAFNLTSAAFGNTPGAICLWTLSAHEGVPAKSTTAHLITLFPSIAILLLSILFTYLYQAKLLPFIERTIR